MWFDAGGTRSGETALVIGTGAIGLATALVARHEGVRVLGADRHPERATAARDCGLADFTTATGTDLEHWVRTRTHSLDLVYDTVCSPATIDLGIRLLAPGGRFVAIASAKPGHTAAIDYAACYARELAFIACRNYVPDDFRRAAALLESGSVDPTPLHTATFALDEFDKALAALETDGHRHIKVLLTPRDRLGSSSVAERHLNPMTTPMPRVRTRTRGIGVGIRPARDPRSRRPSPRPAPPPTSGR